jgi:hypothetical protein
MKYLLSSALGLGLTLAMSVSAQAATCSAYVAGAVTNTDGCQIGTENNDKTNPLPAQVNVDSMFGETTWSFLAKDNTSGGIFNGTDEGNATYLTMSGGTTGAGNWTILNTLFAGYDKFMLVFKGGNGNIDPDDYVGYLIDPTNSGDMNGTYAYSPFIATQQGNQAGISHVSLYGIAGSTPPVVPLPAAGWLLLAGLGGLAAATRRKRA